MNSKPTDDIRRITAKRDRYECARCGRELDHDWSGHSLHHRLPRSHPFPGMHNPSNLIHLCGSGTTGCHGWVHAHPAKSYEAGWLVHMNDDPRDTPLWTARHGWILLDDTGGTTPCTPDGNPRTPGPDLNNLTR